MSLSYVALLHSRLIEPRCIPGSPSPGFDNVLRALPPSCGCPSRAARTRIISPVHFHILHVGFPSQRVSKRIYLASPPCRKPTFVQFDATTASPYQRVPSRHARHHTHRPVRFFLIQRSSVMTKIRPNAVLRIQRVSVTPSLRTGGVIRVSPHDPVIQRVTAPSTHYKHSVTNRSQPTPIRLSNRRGKHAGPTRVPSEAYTTGRFHLLNLSDGFCGIHPEF